MFEANGPRSLVQSGQSAEFLTKQDLNFHIWHHGWETDQWHPKTYTISIPPKPLHHYTCVEFVSIEKTHWVCQGNFQSSYNNIGRGIEKVVEGAQRVEYRAASPTKRLFLQTELRELKTDGSNGQP